MSCTIYSIEMVTGTRYRIHLYTNRFIRYHAALWTRLFAKQAEQTDRKTDKHIQIYKLDKHV